jgi:hypothetical protein
MEGILKTFDEMQCDFSELAKDWLRHELGKDFYAGKVQALVVTTNTVTGRVNIDTCNVNLIADAKKMLREAYDQLDRTQICNALTSIIERRLKEHENAIRLFVCKGSRNKKRSPRSGQGKKVS